MLPVVCLYKAWRYVVRGISFGKQHSVAFPLAHAALVRPWQSHRAHHSLLAPCRKHQKHIALILLSSYLSMPGVLLAQGITVADNARAPALDTAANGVPIVNINAPSAKGVSRNEYDQLNVESKGLIFNNSTAIVQTKLAGYVDGNKRLGGQSAGIILNEVVGNSRSALNGYMEIAGQRAQLIIANQSGITCNGCGFINTSRGVLTTGSSVFDAFGNLSSFDVSKGDVEITGQGFNDTDTDEVDILARSVSLNAKMWANQATVITGDNLINYQDKSVTARSTGDKTGFSLDVAAIGGMYANRIRLIGTEKGLGVNLEGEIKAAADMTLDSQGNLVNKGHLSGQQVSVSAKNINNTGELLGDNIALAATDLNNTGNKAGIQATESLQIQLQGDLNNQDSAKIQATKTLDLQLQGNLTNQGGATIQTPDGLLTINANSIINQSTMAANQLSIRAAQLNNQTESASIYGIDKVDLTLTGQLNNTDSALIQSDNQFVINANGDITNSSATLASIGSITLNSQNLSNTGSILTQNDRLTLTTAQQIDNQGRIQGKGLTITAKEFINQTASGKLSSTQDLVLNVDGNITNQDSALIHADTDLKVTSTHGDLINTQGTLQAINSTTINAQNLINRGTLLAQDDALTIDTATLDNQGALAGNGITINATELNNSTTNGKIYSTDAVALNVQGDVINSEGALVHANTDVTLDVQGHLTNDKSTIEAVNVTKITAQNVTSSGTVLAQDGSLIIDTAALDNQGALAGNGIVINATELNNSTSNGQIYSTDAVALNVQGDVINSEGALIHADTDLTLDAEGNLTNTVSRIEAVNAIKITAQNVTSTGTVLAQDGSLTIDTATLDNQGALAGNGIVINATELNNSTSNGRIYSTDAVALNVQGDITNDDGALIHADTDLTLDAEGNLTNTVSRIEAVNAIKITAQNVTSTGTVLAQDGSLIIDTATLDNQGALAGNGIVINATELNNSTSNGQIYSTDAVALNVQGDITNDGGALIHADTDLTLDAEGSLTNTASRIEAVNSIDITTENVTSSGTVLAQDGSLTIDTNQVTNQGTLAGKGITINATELNNSTANGKIYSTDAVALNVQGDVINSEGALIHADTDLTLDAEGNLTNTASRIEAVNSIDITAENVTSTGTVLAQDGSLIIDTATLDNQGALAGNGITINATELSNSTANAKIYSTDAVALNVQGDITNDDGALIHADTDLTLDAEDNLTNTASRIEAINKVDITADNVESSGTVLAQDGSLTIDTATLDNQGALAGNGIVINATELNNSSANGKIYSTDAVALNVQGDITNDDGALIHADTDLTLDAEGNLTNTASRIEAVNSIDITADNVTSTGTVLAQDGSLTIDTNQVTNQGTLAGKGITINATELNNSTTNGKIYSTDAVALNVQGDVINSEGALVHANTDVTLDAQGHLTNDKSTIEAVNSIDITADNVTSTGTVLAQDGSLIIDTATLDNQGALAGNGIVINATELSNSTANAKIYSTDAVALNVQGDITNDDGALIHADTDLTLDAEDNLTNTASRIEAINKVDITADNVESSGTVLAQDGSLIIDTATLDNQGALAGNGIVINATELNNSSANGKIYSTDAVALNVQGDVINSEGALVHANTDVTLDAQGHLTNDKSTIEAVNSIDITADNVTSIGTVLAQDGSLIIDTATLDNQGALAGNGIVINATELNNSSANGKIYSTDAVALNVQGDVINSEGALVHANTDVTLDAQGHLTNDKSTIEAVNSIDITADNVTSTGTVLAQDGSLIIDTATLDNQGALAGNGIVINATELNNSTVNGKIYSTDAVALNVQGDINNENGALVHADTDLTLDAEGNLTNTVSRIEAVNAIKITAQNVTSTGTVLAQDGSLIIDTATLDNQGALAGNGITINATELSNSTANAKIYSTDAVALNVQGDITNDDGALIHADTDLTLDAEDNLNNTASRIEAVNSIDITADNVESSGTVLAQNGTLTIQTNQVTNQGTLVGKGIVINATELNNSTANGKIYSTDSVVLNIEGAITNQDGALVHADGNLRIDAQGNLTNHSLIESVVAATLNSKVMTNNGRIVTQNQALIMTADSLNNKGVISGHGVSVTAGSIVHDTSTSELLSTGDLTLNTDQDFYNKNGAKIKANNLLTLETKGHFYNQSSFESDNDIHIVAQHVNNSANGVISAENGTLDIDASSSLSNTGGIAANKVDIDSASLSNNGSNALILGRDDLSIVTHGDINNENGAVLYSFNSGDLTTNGTLLNSSSTIETGGDLTINANRLVNKKRVFSVKQDVKTTTYNGVSIAIPSGYYDAKRNYTETVTSHTITADSNQAYLLTGGNLTINAYIDNLYSTISAGKNLTFNSSKLNNVSSVVTNENVKTGTDYLYRKWQECSRNWYGKKKCSTKYETKTRGYNSASSSNQTLAAATFTAQGSIRGKAGEVNNVGLVDDVATSLLNIDSTLSEQNLATSSIDTSKLVGSNNAKINTSEQPQVAVASSEVTINTSEQPQVAVVSSETTINTSEQSQVAVASSETTINTSEQSQVAVASSETTINTSKQPQVAVASSETTISTSEQPQVAVASSETTISTSEQPQVAVASSETTINTSEQPQVTDSNDSSLANIDLETVKSRRDAIFNQNLVNELVSSALFKASDAPNSPVLVETNPLLTNYKSFISSDYLLNKTTGDATGRTGKTTTRLGDGYLEQKLVRDQILSFTGYQTLPDSLDIESTYAALMNNAVDVYEDLGLSTGVELSAAQIAQLQEPIVWMVTETVDTPNGPQQALVPKVYFSAASGLELRPDGALIAASSIDIETDGDINNTGSMLAKVDLSLKGNNIDNSGSVKAGDNANLIANEDINNSGSMQANGTLNLVAGGNITSETLSQTINTKSGSFASTQTLVGQTASLSGGNISLNAGNNINLIASDLKSDDEIFAQAGNNLTLASLVVTNSNRARNDFDESSTEHQVSSLSGNNIQLSAGNSFTSQGAQLVAEEGLTLSANNIDLLAVKDTKDAYSFVGRGGNTTEKRTHNESITGTDLSAGGALTLVSQNDIFSKGSTLSSGEGMTLAAGGDVVLTTETAHNSSYKQVKTKTSSAWGSSKRSTTTTTSQSLTNQGTHLSSGGDLTIASGVDVLLAGSKASAEGDISVQAGGDIQLLSVVDQSSQRYQQQKKGTFKVKANDQGFIKQTAVTSDLIGGGNIHLDSGSNITLEGATLAANDTLTIGTDVVTQNANGQYVNDKGELAGNVTVTTQALESSEWSESSSGFRGVFKDLAKGLAVVASVGTAGLVHGEIKVGESDATRTDTLTQQTTTLAAADLDLTAQQDLTLIGAQVAVSDTANLTAQNVTLDAAQERTVTSTSHTDQTVSGEGASFSSEKGELTLASVTETDRTERTTTTANTWAGSSLQAGNLNIKANQNVAIIASDVSVQNDASIEGENVLIGGRQDTTDTTNDSITKTKTLTVGVKNAYADTYLAVRALDQAKDAVKDAEKAYDDAKQKVADGKLPKNDLDFYKANLAVATANVASATTAIYTAGATAAATGGSGFYATAGVTTQTDTTSTTTSQTQWNGSNIQVGGNTSLTSNNDLNIEGSTVATGGQLALNADNINITAGKNTYTENTESHSEGGGISVSMQPTTTSYSGSINASQSRSDYQATDYVNSQIGAGSLVSNSDDLTIQGGNVSADDVDITTGRLTVESLQNTSSGSSTSAGFSVSASLGGSDEGWEDNNEDPSKSPAAAGVTGFGVNASKGNSEKAWVAQQSGITGGQVNITAKDTSLTGAVIAAVDEQGQTTDKLTLTTGTLTVTDIQDTDTSQNIGLGYSVSGLATGETPTDNTDPDAKDPMDPSQSTYSASFNGHDKQQTTKATIGLGNVTVGGTNIDEQAQFADLNRDITNSQETTKDMERGGLDTNLTVDNRLLTASGRQQIAKDITDTSQHASEIAQAVEDVATTDQGIFDVFGNIQDYAEERIVLTQKAMDKKAQEKLKGEEGAEGSQEGMQELSDALTKAQGLDEKANVELYDGSLVQDDTLVIDKTEVNKSEVEGAYHEGGNTIYANIDKTDMTDSSKVVATLVHEQTRYRLDQEGSTGSLSRDDQTTLATNHGDRAEEVWNAYSNLAGISTTSSTSQTAWNAANRNTSVVQAGTTQIASVDNTELKARQFTRTEASLLDQARAKIQDSALSEEAKAEKITELEQIACAKVKCAAGVSENDQLYDSLNALQEAGEEQVASGENIYDVLHELGVETPTKSNGRMGGRSESTFGYNGVTAFNDVIDSNEKLVTKTTQAVSAVAGGAEVAAGAALCSTGAGCLVGGGLATLGAVTAKQSVDALNSEYVYESGQRVTDSFSLETHGGSHNPALDAALELGVSAAGGAAAKTALKYGDDAYDAAKSALKGSDGITPKADDIVTTPVESVVTKRTVDNPVDLTDFRKDHILNRHAPGAGQSDKTEFPADWDESKILHEISDVATDPKSTVTPGRWGADRIQGTRDGIDITVDLYPSNSKHAGKISTAYPTNTPVNP